MVVTEVTRIRDRIRIKQVDLAVDTNIRQRISSTYISYIRRHKLHIIPFWTYVHNNISYTNLFIYIKYVFIS